MLLYDSTLIESRNENIMVPKCFRIASLGQTPYGVMQYVYFYSVD